MPGRWKIHGSLCIGLAVIALSADCARTRELFFPGIIGSDDRQVIDSSEVPWSSIGRINFAGYSKRLHCTGSLVAPDLVVTAAHCLFDDFSEKQLDPARIHFQAGFRRQHFLAHSTAKCVRLLKNFRYARKPTLATITSDVAVIVLNNALPVTAIPLAQDDTRVGAEVVHVGYGRDRRHVLSGHFGCHVRSVDGGLLATDCDTNLGQSGGPVLIQVDGELRLAAIMVGSVHQKVTAAIDVSTWRELLSPGDCSQ